MEELKELLKGVAVIIDDEIGDSNAKITNIIQQIKDQNIPFLEYPQIPPKETIHQFRNISFLLLDWKLYKISTENIAEGKPDTSYLQKENENYNIEFLRKFKDVCFCPIFIFTKEDTDYISNLLEDEGLYSKDKKGHILIKSKAELHGRTKLFIELKKWLKSNPSIYVLKEWEREYLKAKNTLFSEFQTLSPNWPRILWENFDTDGTNKSIELGELISRNLYTRMTPFEFSEEILNKKARNVTELELRQVLEGEHFQLNDKLKPNDIGTGDIFKVRSDYLINIRAVCDLIPDRAKNDSNLDDVQLYLLKGTKLSKSKVTIQFDFQYGHFKEIESQTIIFPVHNGKAIDFRFKKLEIRAWSELKDKRIGRLLPPYINKIQQKYALYLQRQGLPRIPAKAIQKFS